MKCKECGQIVHTKCCRCNKPLPSDWDEYICESCLIKPLHRINPTIDLLKEDK